MVVVVLVVVGMVMVLVNNHWCITPGMVVPVLPLSRERLLERGSFFTRYASEIESDPVGEYSRARCRTRHDTNITKSSLVCHDVWSKPQKWIIELLAHLKLSS